eukprot:SAG31_NODE_27154_length_430_cov_1.184290_1_plen_58_part_00
MCLVADMCAEATRLNPVYRDVRGAYMVDPEKDLLLNPISKANVGIGDVSLFWHSKTL